MDTLRELFKIGFGPSSSHTMGPHKAALKFLEQVKDLPVQHFVVELYGSLAATGKGHLTDWIIMQTLGEDRTSIIFKPEVVYDYHANGMKFFAYDENNVQLAEYLVFSVGGGDIRELNESRKSQNKVYHLSTMNGILTWCKENHKQLYEYVLYSEGEEIFNYLREVWQVMKSAVEEGLQREGLIPGILGLRRRAKSFYERYLRTKDFTTLIFACSQAVSEQNASGSRIVTAPTCGASGALPGLLYSFQLYYGYSDEEIIKALAIAGLIGNVVKENGSISGAEAGCQAEIGTACAMAAGACCYLMGGDNQQIEYAAEIGLEHHLGLTCDPVEGLVQVPCIERNPIAARRAYDAAQYALLTDGEHIITLDMAIQTMKETGKDLNSKYRETSTGGLAKFKLGRR
ncbi:MAG: serine dehydratase [Bacilli bacterium]|nr:serine dehydratase [Bacilli bacterium]